MYKYGIAALCLLLWLELKKVVHVHTIYTFW